MAQRYQSWNDSCSAFSMALVSQFCASTLHLKSLPTVCARKGSGGDVPEMAKEGQTTSRSGHQSRFNSVQEVGVVSDGDLEKRVGGFGRGQVVAVVGGRKIYCTTKAGGSEEGLL
jgi:hypothetical protein